MMKNISSPKPVERLACFLPGRSAFLCVLRSSAVKFFRFKAKSRLEGRRQLRQLDFDSDAG
jgi:hypothetical protein